MKKKRTIYAVIIVFVIIIGLGLWLANYQKIVGTVRGPELNEIVIDDVTYVWATSEKCPYGREDKSYHIGKGAWADGTRVLDLYKIKGDDAFNYLYARWEWEGQMYMRQDLIE